MSDSLLFPLSFGEKREMQISGSSPLLAGWEVVCGLPVPLIPSCPQQGHQKGNTENQRHLVATGTFFKFTRVHGWGDRILVMLEEGNGVFPQLDP